LETFYKLADNTYLSDGGADITVYNKSNIKVIFLVFLKYQIQTIKETSKNSLYLSVPVFLSTGLSKSTVLIILLSDLAILEILPRFCSRTSLFYVTERSYIIISSS
jgi:hypothetical protein